MCMGVCPCLTVCFYLCVSCHTHPHERACAGIKAQLQSGAYGNIIMAPSPTLDLIMILETLSLCCLPASLLEARRGMCESPQQRGYMLESLRQREASPLGYSQRSMDLCLPPLTLLALPHTSSSTFPSSIPLPCSPLHPQPLLRA